MFRSMTILTAGIFGLISLASPALAGGRYGCSPSYGYSCSPCYSYSPCYTPCYSYTPCYTPCYQPCYGYSCDYRSAPVFGFEGPNFDAGPGFSAPQQQQFSAPAGRPNFAPSSPAVNGNPVLAQNFNGGATRSAVSTSTSNFTPQSSGITRSVSNSGFGSGGLAQIPQNQGRSGVGTTPSGTTIQQLVAPKTTTKAPTTGNNGPAGRRR